MVLGGDRESMVRVGLLEFERTPPQAMYWIEMDEHSIAVEVNVM